MQKIDAFIDSLKTNRKKVFLFFLIAFFFFSIISISRRIDSVTSPQFWAEDGAIWYANAYNMGPFSPFLVPVSGYFQTVSRVGAAISLLVPLQYAPLVFNLIAISIQVLPALFFLSRRFEHVVSSVTIRFAMGFAYLVLPSTFETHINLSNAQWRLSLLLFLIIIARRSDSRTWKIFDILFLLLAGLSGPFSIVALPIVLFYCGRLSNKQSLYKILIIAITGLIQFASVLIETAKHARGQVNLGASVLGFFKILAGKIFIGGLLGSSVYGLIWKSSWWTLGYAAVIISIVGLLMIFYSFAKSNLEFKLFLAYSYGIFLLTLIFPMVSSTELSEWDSMLRPNGGNRYFFLPMLAWIVTIGWTYFIFQKSLYLKYLTTLLLCLFIFVGVPLGWKIKSFKDYHFSDQVKQFEKKQGGQTMDIRINPGWNMTLTKK